MNKIYYWKLLCITQNWYCGRFIQRSENLGCNGNDNIDNHNHPQFEHEWDSVCIMCAHLCSTSAFHQLNFWFQCKHVTNGQYSYFPFCYLNSLLFSSFRTWFVYIFFLIWLTGKNNVWPTRIQKNSSYACFPHINWVYLL